MSNKTEFARIVPSWIQEKAVDLVISAAQEDVETILCEGDAGAANKAYRVASFRGRVMNMAITALFADAQNETTTEQSSPNPNAPKGHAGSDIGDLGDTSLRRCGCHKFSAPNYAFRSIPQLRQLQKDLIEEYMNNRDIEWFSEQSRLIDAATQIAYSKGRY
ncbi:hypothetical protein PRH55_000256 [Morganella morganii]|nr:hypothetical protein [Morganella morganii]